MPRIFFVLLTLVMAFSRVAFATQGLPDSIRVVTWNLEWWADGATHDAATQVSKTKMLISAIDADFYGFQEVVNVDSFNSMVSSLPGGPWAALVSPYGSTAADPQSARYSSAQKLGFLYRPAQFRNVTARAFLANHPYAYYDFASGRYPFLVQGEWLCSDGSWKPISFIVLHAKAMSDASSCNRREEGAYILKDTLDRKFAGKNFLILGDFNDDLDTSICVDRLQSNYLNFVNDSAGAVSYKCLTLLISRAGERSLDNYTSLLDHFIASSTLAAYSKPGSTHSLRTFVNATMSNYTDDVSDHYPVITSFYRPAGALAVSSAMEVATTFSISPNPVTTSLRVSGLEDDCRYQIINLLGQTLSVGIVDTQTPVIDVSVLAKGTYLLHLSLKNAPAQWLRFVKE